MQEPDGAIPWTVGEHVDVWNHVEAAMALLVGGEVEAAEAAYAWCAAHASAHDGSWPMKIVAGEVEDASGETNMSAYLAVGVWHHWLLRRDLAFVERMWPVVRRGLDFVVGLQLPFGGIAWSQEWDEHGPAKVNEEALLAGSSSIYQSLRAGRGARRAGRTSRSPSGSWPAAASGTRCASTATCSWTSRRSRWTGTTRSSAAPSAGRPRLDLLATRWDDFVVPGLGIRCVDTNPWVTGAETCELVMALDCLDDHERALQLFADMQHLRHENGSYWTGSVHPDDVFWPDEQTTYTAAAVILAADELSRTTPASGIMRGETLSRALPRDRARVRLPGRRLSRRLRPAAPEVRASTRIDPTVSRGVNAPLVDRALPDVERRLAAVLRALEDVVDHQHPAGLHPAGEAGVVVLGVLLGVPAVDEQQRERRTPVARRRWSSARPRRPPRPRARRAAMVRRKTGSVSIRPDLRRRPGWRRGAPSRPGSPPSRGGGRG